jgi:formamidase
VPSLANAPFAATAHCGTAKGDVKNKIAAEGARSAIEMAGWLHLKVDVIKGGMAKYGIKNPIFKPSPIVPTYNNYLIFEGISVDEAGTPHYLDGHIAYRQACLNAIEYLTKFGYSRASLRHFGSRAGAGTYFRRRRHSERLRDTMAADRLPST